MIQTFNLNISFEKYNPIKKLYEKLIYICNTT